MSNPNVINNDGNRTEGIAREGIAALTAAVAVFSLAGCKADIATASAPSDAPNTPLPAASAPVTPGSSETKPLGAPLCKDIMEKLNITDPKAIPGVFRFNDDTNGDGWDEAINIKGETICLFR